MIYLHDLHVNWCDAEEYGYQVYHYEQWEKTDTVELLDQVPLIKVTAEFFSFILNDLDTIPEQLLKDINEKAYIRKNHERLPIEHCCVISDGKDVLAFDTLEFKTPMRKSRLIPRQHTLALEMVFDEQPVEYEFEAIDKDHTGFELLSPHPLSMVGLTRREIQLKTIFNMALDDILHKRNHSELVYWFSEIVPNGLEQIKHNTFDEIKQKLIDYVKDGFKTEWVEVIENFAKCSEFVAAMYQLEKEKSYIMG